MSSEATGNLYALGAVKAGQRIIPLLLRSAQAGVYIALAAQFAAVTGVGSKEVLGFGLGQMLVGLSFSLGLILVILGGAELFTGANLTVGAACLAGGVRLSSLLRHWSLCYLGNLLGSLLVVALLIGSGLWQQAGEAVGDRLVAIAAAKTQIPFWAALLRGIGCNILVCLAVLLASTAGSAGGKILAIIFPVTAFIAMGFEHSVANMYYLPAGVWLNAVMGGQNLPGLTIWVIIRNLIPVTIGNIIGGWLVVGGSYCWIDRPRRPGGRGVAL